MPKKSNLFDTFMKKDQEKEKKKKKDQVHLFNNSLLKKKERNSVNIDNSFLTFIMPTAKSHWGLICFII